MSRNVRSLAIALLLTLVLAPAVQALPLDKTPGSGLIERILSRIGTLLSSGPTTVWERAGSDMDPNGRPQDDPLSPPASDAGSQMDPNG